MELMITSFCLTLLATALPGGYSELETASLMEEHFGKVVGNRLRPPDPLSIQASRKTDAIAWRRALGGVRVPRGVYRFRSHEEADKWLWRMITRPRPS